jgi:hypothetical protein
MGRIAKLLLLLFYVAYASIQERATLRLEHSEALRLTNSKIEKTFYEGREIEFT